MIGLDEHVLYPNFLEIVLTDPEISMPATRARSVVFMVVNAGTPCLASLQEPFRSRYADVERCRQSQSS